MKQEIKLEKYKRKVAIEAVKYEPGMEDGFNIRYCSQQDMDDFNAGLKDSVSTWGIPSLDGTETVEIKIPYVEVDGRKILLGNGLYLVKDEDGRYFGIMDTEFFEKYEKL